MKLYVIPIKNGIPINITVIIKNLVTGVLVKMVIYEVLVCVIMNIMRHVKLMNT